jgi:hypothetical protein
MKIVEVEFNPEESKNYNFEMYAEYEDGYSCYIYGEDEENCMYEIGLLMDKHKTCTYYTSVNNEDRTDGEWIGRENYIYE